MVFLTRRERFNAAHRLYNKEWSDEKNKEVFGKCSNANYHGHNFELFVTVKGLPDPDTGFIVNAHSLSVLLQSEIIDKLDHSNLNLDVDFLKDVLPSSENIVIAIWGVLEKLITDCELHCIKLVETENIFVEYYGPQ